MSSGRVLMIGLDAFEISLAEMLMNRGELPHMRELRDRSARYRLNHGLDKYSGLAWEHVSTGIAPSDGGRWSAVHFDPQIYAVRQHATSKPPFFANLPIPTVVFDMPYCDLRHAPNAAGIIDWGAHDPGAARMSRPAELAEEISRKFGPYPATESLYGFCWPSVEKTKKLSDELTRALSMRAKAARWMLTEKLPDWKLGIVVASEAHSGTEPLWHGVEEAHPLHGLPSAKAAKQGLEDIYRGIDALIGELTGAFSDATVVLFSMHGMGRNDADIAAMLLLPEFLYRHAFGKPYARECAWHGHLNDGTPLLPEDSNWERAMEDVVPKLPEPSARTILSRLATRFGFKEESLPDPEPLAEGTLLVDWMPVSRYRNFWPRMAAFALPSFYDGRIRINLRGRERRGIVPREKYESAREQLCALLRECTNVQTGEPVVEDFVRAAKDPMDLGACEADLSVIFRSAPMGLAHPRLGKVGPYPWRRTGGHTGESGFLYLAGSGIAAGDHGTRSSFDVVPTVIDLLGCSNAAVSGKSILKSGTPAARATVPA